MERLTARSAGIPILEPECKVRFTHDELIDRLIGRLAAYEDTGLTPEICANYKKFEDEAISKGVTFNRIVELMEAERDGRLVVLPCKPWDKVWVIDNALDRSTNELTKTICEGEIVKLAYNGFTTPQEWIDYRWDSLLFGQTTKHDRIDLCLGKTVFLTREDAEAALKELQEVTDEE